MTELGPHLLGRLPSPEDPRDFRLGNFIFGALGTAVDPADEIDRGVADLKATTVSFKKWAATTYADVTKTHWWRAFDHFTRARNALVAPAPVNDRWANADPLLDQGDTPHCVGFSGGHWGNTLPVDDHFANDDGHALYYECKVLDGEPKRENGTYVRSLAKALQNRARLSAYAFAASADEVAAWVTAKGPVVFGTNWYDQMFYPDETGLVFVGGSLVGGHAYLCDGFDSVTRDFLFTNSWGTSWGDNGRFRITYDSAKRLLSEDGEAMAAVELPL